ncbi:MAG TPA: hypothetical protein VFD32_01990, partial [Dehalococcoidia bacterium]|nr:hypothetical protein [Dehalococcoidia bacterium]
MHRTRFLALPALALTLALVSCGSSKNNSNKNNGLFTQVAATQAVATQAAPTAATTVAAPQASATKASGSTGGSATTAATVISTQVSTTTGGRSTTTTTTTTTGGSGASVSASSVSSSSSSACSTGSSTSGGTVDANLQSQLAKVALGEKDLPAGYTSLSGLLGGGDSDLTFANQTAAYSDFFIKGNLTNLSSDNPFAGNVVIESLNGFKDGGAAGSTLKDLRLQALKQECSPDTKIEPVSGAPKLGDETLAYKITSTDSSQPYS